MSAGAARVNVSGHYKKLRSNQIDVACEIFNDAWQNPEIPALQFESVVKNELEDFRSGKECAPFDALVTLLRKIPDWNNPSLLDVGASSGYYSEVLRIAQLACRYTALDYSTYYKDLAEKL